MVHTILVLLAGKGMVSPHILDFGFWNLDRSKPQVHYLVFYQLLNPKSEIEIGLRQSKILQYTLFVFLLEGLIYLLNRVGSEKFYQFV